MEYAKEILLLGKFYLDKRSKKSLKEPYLRIKGLFQFYYDGFKEENKDKFVFNFKKLNKANCIKILNQYGGKLIKKFIFDNKLKDFYHLEILKLINVFPEPKNWKKLKECSVGAVPENFQKAFKERIAIQKKETKKETPKILNEYFRPFKMTIPSISFSINFNFIV